jgi:hypothetical protein
VVAGVATLRDSGSVTQHAMPAPPEPKGSTVSENPQSPRDVPGDLPPPPAEGSPADAARAAADAPTILPFDQAPLAPPPPSPFDPQPAQYGPSGPPLPPVPVKKKASTGKIIGLVALVLVVVAVLCVGGLVLFAFNKYGDRVENAAVGDCLPASIQDPGADISKIDKVECGSADAVAKIVGIVENRAVEDVQTDATLCTQFTTAKSRFWVGPPGKKGKVFCLEPIKK